MRKNTTLSADDWLACAPGTVATIAALANGYNELEVWAQNSQGLQSTTATPLALVYAAAGPCAANPAFVTNASVVDNGPSPHVVCTLDQLQQLNDNLGETFILGADIDASKTNPASPFNAGSTWDNGGRGWSSIGDQNVVSYPFYGGFDCGGYAIHGLFINRPATEAVGLFSALQDDGSIGDNELADLKLVDCKITGKGYVGAAAGSTTTKLRNITVDGCEIHAVATGNAGAVAGYAEGEAHNIQVTATVTAAGSYAGVAFGRLADTASDLRVDGSVQATGSYVGGIGGSADSGSITRAFSTATVSGGGQVGGLAGYCAGALQSGFASGNVTGAGNNVGGLFGEADSPVSRAFATGHVVAASGTTSVGGLIGFVGDNVYDVFSTGAVDAPGGHVVGGLLGRHFTGNLQHAYTLSNVNTTGTGTAVGGLIGLAEDVPRFIYASNTVNGADPGGMVGTADYLTSGTTAFDWVKLPTATVNDCWSIGRPPDSGYPQTCNVHADLAAFLASAPGAEPFSSFGAAWSITSGHHPRLACPAGWPWDCATTWQAAQAAVP